MVTKPQNMKKIVFAFTATTFWPGLQSIQPTPQNDTPPHPISPHILNLQLYYANLRGL